MSKKFDYCIVIGRFNPIHKGHQDLINETFKVAEKTIILIGSSFQPRTIKNPFTAEERISLISKVYPSTTFTNIKYGFLRDYMYNDQKWVMQVQEVVDKIIESDQKDPNEVSICILGGKKDSSSYYLDMFPQWKFIEYKFAEGKKLTSSTEIRELLFTAQTNEHEKKIKPLLNEEVFKSLENYFKQDWFKNLILEFDHIKRYKEAWAKAPYAPTFITTDAVITCSGHVLMIERRSAPGKGLWALPGGFLDQNERVEEGMIRELREETKIKVPAPILKGSIKEWKVFDHPNRSLRGRTVTHAAYIDLGIGELPRVKGSDDAAKAKWIPFVDLNEETIFEDHLQIINDFLGI